MNPPQVLVLALALAVLLVGAKPVRAMKYEFTTEALNAITGNELRRTKLCVVNDIRSSRLQAARKGLLQDQDDAHRLGRLDFAKSLDTDLAKVETELAEVTGNFSRCDGAFLLGPKARELCKKLGPKKGTLCPALASAKAEGAGIPQIVETMESLVTGQGEQAWQIVNDPDALGPDGRTIGAAVRRGNLQVAFRVGALHFPMGSAADAVPRDMEKQLKDVNRGHGLWLREDDAIFVPFLTAEVSGATGFAGETFQTLVGVKAAEGYVPLGPAVPVSIEAKATSHGVPLDAKAWADLPSFEVIGILGSKRSGDADEFLYFIGLETLGIQPMLDQLMAELRGRQP